jgi:hypothetical protein
MFVEANHLPAAVAHDQVMELGVLPAEVSGRLASAELTYQDQVQALRQENLDLRRRAEERDEGLAAAREANRRLMTELNKARS